MASSLLTLGVHYITEVFGKSMTKGIFINKRFGEVENQLNFKFSDIKKAFHKANLHNKWFVTVLNGKFFFLTSGK